MIINYVNTGFTIFAVLWQLRVVLYIICSNKYDIKFLIPLYAENSLNFHNISILL